VALNTIILFDILYAHGLCFARFFGAFFKKEAGIRDGNFFPKLVTSGGE
jgi:hypothetical protein